MEQVIILMAAYQGEAFLKEQLDSILTQDYPNWKLIIQDDGSEDGTMPLLLAYADRCPDKISIRQGDAHYGAARNFLTLLHSCANANVQKNCHLTQDLAVKDKIYYMFADQDDIWHPNKISRTLKRMKQMEKKYGSSIPALVFTDAVVVDENLNTLAPSFFAMQHLNIKKCNFTHLMMENLCLGCTIMMNHALASQLKQVPQYARYHDWWMALMAACLGHISYLPEATMDYRQHGSNAVGSKSFGEYIKRRWLSLKEQKHSLAANYKQAEEFNKLYKAALPRQYRQQLKTFIRLRYMNAAERRITAFQMGAVKSGIARNIGLLLIL